MTKDEALQLALEAMEEIIHWYPVRDRNNVFLNFVDQNPEIQKIMKSITAIKETLETKDEPVVWMNRHGACKTSLFIEVEAGAKEEYTIPLYTTPQRTWVGLTNDELVDLVIKHAGFPTLLSEAIEAKLKEKNN